MSRSLYARLALRYSPDRVLLSRRQLLASAALAAASGLLAGASQAAALAGRNVPAGGGRRKKVIVVGAGFAGLSCALELAGRGHDVTVFEGRGRVGGRVVSMRDLSENAAVEAGGEWIGANHPTWLSLAERFKLILSESPEEEGLYSPLYLRGNLLSEQATENLYEEMSACLSSMNDAAAAVDAAAPWNAPGAADLDRKSVADWLAERECSDLCKAALDAQITNDNGVPIAWQSLLGNLAMVKGGGLQDYWDNSEVFRCRQGNQELATRMYLEITPERVMLSNPATKIEYGSSGSVRVTDGRGRAHEGDYAVLAVAPSVWRSIAFSPALTPDVMVQMGSASKMLCLMKSAAWKEMGLSAESLSDTEIGYTWDSTAIHPATRQPVLCAFSGGPNAEVGIRMNEPERNAEYARYLGRLYKGIAEQVESMRYIGWPADRWTMAGYSFPAPGQVTTRCRALAEGLGNLLFAGEHTSTAFTGYMEGALASGVTTARRIDAA